jgi:hypothetical protein
VTRPRPARRAGARGAPPRTAPGCRDSP